MLPSTLASLFLSPIPFLPSSSSSRVVDVSRHRWPGGVIFSVASPPPFPTSNAPCPPLRRIEGNMAMRYYRETSADMYILSPQSRQWSSCPDRRSYRCRHVLWDDLSARLIAPLPLCLHHHQPSQLLNKMETPHRFPSRMATMSRKRPCPPSLELQRPMARHQTPRPTAPLNKGSRERKRSWQRQAYRLVHRSTVDRQHSRSPLPAGVKVNRQALN